jgi:hypothetical protein
VIITNTSIVYYYSKNSIELPQPIAAFIEAFEELFGNKTRKSQLGEAPSQSELDQKTSALALDNNLNNGLPKKANDFISENSFKSRHELSSIGGTCSSKLKGPTQQNIYKWVDDNGMTHLSDKPRAIHNDSLVTVIGVIQPELVSIKYLNNEGSLVLKNKINASVVNAKQFFERVVPKSLVTPVSIDFRLFSEKNKYESYRRKMAPNLGPSNGFYTSINNESVVMMHSTSQGVSTSVHEAMHSINRHWFGAMSRWLNEGIAEYAEKDQSIALKDTNWFLDMKAMRIASLTTLLQSGEVEWRNQQRIMYATSFAFIAYLMDEQRPLLSRLLLAENVNGCDRLQLKDVERISGLSVSSLQRSFNVWLNNTAT